jgi:hypothetical protein
MASRLQRQQKGVYNVDLLPQSAGRTKAKRGTFVVSHPCWLPLYKETPRNPNSKSYAILYSFAQHPVFTAHDQASRSRRVEFG